MTLRNFWIETAASGRKTKDATGPRTADGGFVTYVHVNDHGTTKLAIVVEGYVKDGELRLVVEDTIDNETLYKRAFTRG